MKNVTEGSYLKQRYWEAHFGFQALGIIVIRLQQIHNLQT